jgi:hypothetical protein
VFDAAEGRRGGGEREKAEQGQRQESHEMLF